MNELSGVVEVDGYETRDTIEVEVEFEVDSLNNSGQIFACGFGGAGDVDVSDLESETFTEGGEGRLGNLLIKARTAFHVDIVIVGRGLNVDIRLLGVRKEILCLFGFI